MIDLITGRREANNINSGTMIRETIDISNFWKLLLCSGGFN
jgi:hypothetical protein